MEGVARVTGMTKTFRPRPAHRYRQQRPLESGNRSAPVLARTSNPQPAETLQREPRRADASGDIPPVVHDVLSTPGQPLDPSARAYFEPRFGHDFAQVRVHRDAVAARSAEAIGAKAYTAGAHIVFGDGRYDTACASGQRLLAHELTHVVQQGNAPALEGTVPRIARSGVVQAAMDAEPAVDEPNVESWKA